VFVVAAGAVMTRRIELDLEMIGRTGPPLATFLRKNQ
jgi:hypothetical protein